eukprot:TCONS_00013412-protein
MLPYNFFANNAIDYLMIQSQNEKAIQCTACSDKTDAISRCVECSEFLCLCCVTAHRRIRVTKDHKIIPLDTLRYDQSMVHRPVYCPTHSPEVFTYFCEVCKELVCKDCTILEHRGHKYERLSEALENQKPSVMKLLATNEKEKIPPIARALDDVQDMAARLHARTIATKQAVRSCTERCIREIEERCKILLSNIDNLYREKSDVLHKQQEVLQEKLMKNKAANQFVNYAFQHGSEAEIFELLDLMKTRLTDLNDEDLGYDEPEENDVIDHQFDSKAVEHIAENLGKIATSSVFLSYTKLYGPGVRTAKAEIETFFMIEVFDRKKERCCDHFSPGAIKVKIHAPEGFLINNKITDNRDGTFTVRYTPVTKGRYDVTVKIRGKSFPKNQFSVRVFEGIDYLKIGSNFLCFGERGVKNGEFKQPYGIATNSQGQIYVTDKTNNRVQIFDKFGTFLSEFGSRGTKQGQFSGPEGIAVDQAGMIFVADTENHRIQAFNANGTYHSKFGTKGSEEGELLSPCGIAIDKIGNICVADRGNHRVQVFTPEGKSLLSFGSYGDQYGQLNSPSFLAINNDNWFIVADNGNNRIVCYDSNGLYAQETGAKGSDPGEFSKPNGIVVDQEGFIIVSDTGNNRVQVLTPDLKYFSQFGCHGNNDVEFKQLTDVALTQDGRVAVSDTNNYRVQVF